MGCASAITPDDRLAVSQEVANSAGVLLGRSRVDSLRRPDVVDELSFADFVSKRRPARIAIQWSGEGV